MPPSDQDLDPRTGLPWTLRRRFLRSLARRFPGTRRVLATLHAKLRHYGGQVVRRLSSFGATGRWIRSTSSAVIRRRREGRLTVGVDVTPLWEPLTGVGWYLYRLLEHLSHRDDLAIRLYGPTVIDSPDRPRPTVPLPEGPALEEVVFDVPTDLVVPATPLIRFLRRCEPALLAAEGNEVLFAPNYLLPRMFACALGAQVATIHDLGSRLVPWTLEDRTLAQLERRLERAIGRADRLISVSGAVRNELADQGLAPRSKVTVVRHGPGQLADVVPGRVPEGVPARFGLHVGTLEPRKNIEGLLGAWRSLRTQVADPPDLVLCGKFGWRSDSIRRDVEAAGEEGWLHHLGYVAEAELAALFRDSVVVAFPTWYEGFGLPAIEALHAGTPLVCSDIPVLREVAGDAALFAPPDDPEAFAAALGRVVRDDRLRDELTSRGREVARRFSWDDAADRTAGVWRIAGGRPPARKGGA